MEKMPSIISRQAARDAGLPRYFTGKPCPKGHVCERQTCNKKCIQCRREYQIKVNARPESKAKRATYDRQRWEEDRDYLVTKNKRYYSKNHEAVNAQKREYWAENRDRMKAARALWGAENAHVIRHLNAARKKHIKRATPPWANMADIKAVYLEAERLTRETGVEHHVDHIVPLKGEMVCGLHVPCNLRAIPWRENVSKKNKFEP